MGLLWTFWNRSSCILSYWLNEPVWGKNGVIQEKASTILLYKVFASVPNNFACMKTLYRSWGVLPAANDDPKIRTTIWGIRKWPKTSAIPIALCRETAPCAISWAWNLSSASSKRPEATRLAVSSLVWLCKKSSCRILADLDSNSFRRLSSPIARHPNAKIN